MTHATLLAQTRTPTECQGTVVAQRRQYSDDIFWVLYRCDDCQDYPIFAVEGRPHWWNYLGK